MGFQVNIFSVIFTAEENSSWGLWTEKWTAKDYQTTSCPKLDSLILTELKEVKEGT